MLISSVTTTASTNDTNSTSGAAQGEEATFTAAVYPTDLRMNDHYVFWYNNLAKLIITGEGNNF